MKNKHLEQKLGEEIIAFLNHRKTLSLASLDEQGAPYASYAPFAVDDNSIFVLLSDIALHGKNLKRDKRAAVQVVEDETEAASIFARIRVSYQVEAHPVALDSEAYQSGIECLSNKHGDRINKLAVLSDFNLFRLTPLGGRYVKDFGRAFEISGHTLAGDNIERLRDGHKPRAANE
ncbi:pyridoxamine 5'-phosphate oxidase family protein [Aestuariirhabdus sp. Z084]|uniref:HugZ family pyridoxamine 5'-phosphate oxidase n=1 Tax=Aestuariirhabdus haliotis TaxID=2918751 RepID=UPI00201B3A8C|nr:pyridoxamine 5'-phosphate oxidase family protein [Aestuariirhabdus haliotis]MCL6417468.1 pyridoxamine 5'-phosphate oxidase family protein [Aestuariirhabdus haliotis]MCL6421413.1 pyridoxamine 5'-phosphate oxidase family protein [Aestuariirhabdus haliotis]